MRLTTVLALLIAVATLPRPAGAVDPGLQLVTCDHADDRVDVTVAATAAGVTQASIEAALTHISFGDGVIKVNATPVLGSQQGAIASLGPTASLADARTAVNAIIAALHAHGLIA
jgi:hypothetical protein